VIHGVAKFGISQKGPFKPKSVVDEVDFGPQAKHSVADIQVNACPRQHECIAAATRQPRINHCGAELRTKRHDLGVTRRSHKGKQANRKRRREQTFHDVHRQV
jgi:hypothetical protein